MEYIVLILLILLNGFFSLSEISIVSSKGLKLEILQRQGKRGAGVALKLQQNSENFLSAIQTGITLVSLITGLVGGNNIARKLEPFFANFNIFGSFANEIALVVSMIIITYLSIVFGELVPKTIGLNKPETMATAVAPLINFLARLLFPFVRLLAVSTNAVNHLLGIKKQDEQFSELELRQMLRTASSQGVIEEEQNVIHENIFNFSDKNAQHLMTYRSEIEWIDINSEQEIIKKELDEFLHSKIVVCNDDLDNFLGVLQLKDYYKQTYLQKEINISVMLTQPITVPETASAQHVLDLLRADESKICFVVNEFGGLEGIITLYDVMENIVGQIPESGDDPDVFVREDNSVLVNGDASVETLEGIIDNFTVDFDKVDYHTVAGFVLSIINEIPKVGYVFNYQDYIFEIVDMDGRRIDKILITKNSDV